MAGLGTIFVMQGMATIPDWQDMRNTTLASLFLVACLYIPLRPNVISRAAARYALFVYLAHPAVLSVIDRAVSLSKTDILRASSAIGVTLVCAMLWDFAKRTLWTAHKIGFQGKE